MTTSNELLTIIDNQRNPLLAELKKLDTDYRTKRADILSRLKPLSRAYKALAPKTPKEPKAPKAPKKGAKSVAK